eukprot:scaffold200497_cov68-Attheya_sp.AAC.1
MLPHVPGLSLTSMLMLELIAMSMVSFRGAGSLQEKQMHMLAYDIALASTNNASTSPGFETPMGVFSGASGL